MWMKKDERKIARWLLLTGLMLPAGVVLAEPPGELQDGYLQAAAAAQRGDYVVAYCFWHPLAEQGDAEAQYALGWMYHNGYGLVSDDEKARFWWEKAIAQDHAEAMFSLGTLYSVGSETIERNNVAAMKLWVRAAEAGNENARFALRELVQRNLPELKSLTSLIRAQDPHLLGDPPKPAARMPKKKAAKEQKTKEGTVAVLPEGGGESATAAQLQRSDK
ncbi:MAG TPA: tetratricopeptide repeat protein [Gammaproteobacteria bacterium]